MTRECVKAVLALIKLAYPYYYKDFSTDELLALIKLWEIQFNGYKDDDITSAVNCLISTNKYPPTISEIKDIIISHSVKYLDSHKAWEKVEECLKSTYDTEKKYNELDENIKAVLSLTDIYDMKNVKRDELMYSKNKFIEEYREKIRNNYDETKYKQLSGNLMIEKKGV